MRVIRNLWRCGCEFTRQLLPRDCDVLTFQAERQGFALDKRGDYCERCGASMGPGAANTEGCAFCHGQSLAWDRLVRLGSYRPPISSWIVQMKYRRNWSWATWFGEQLAGRLPNESNPSRIVVCPVPMHWLRRCVRGYNQAQLIASSLGRARGYPLVELLRRTRHTNPQTQTPLHQRERNVAGAFAVKAIDLKGWTVWLVDDVKTSGATLTGCARLLRKNGAERVHVAVAAVADPRFRDFQAI